MDANESRVDEEKEWWILKPGMSDRGNGIRLFNSMAQLQEIFEEWEELLDSDNDDEDEEESDVKLDDKQISIHTQAVATSHLRHFVVQPYIDPPLLLPSASKKKFHIRTYVLVIGSLKVYVWKEMLALFAEKPYMPPGDEGDGLNDLSRHLTNTCLQDDPTVAEEEAVHRFWDLEDELPSSTSSTDNGKWKQRAYEQICAVTGEVFEAAARGMAVHFQSLPNAFELFGVDFLVDAAGDVWLLELNAFPDFGKTGEGLKEVVVGQLFEAVVNAAVKPFFTAKDNQATQDGGVSGLDLVADLDLGRRSENGT
jgi:tubulin--tyrosine ligase